MNPKELELLGSLLLWHDTIVDSYQLLKLSQRAKIGSNQENIRIEIDNFHKAQREYKSTIPEGSRYVGISLGESGLRENDVNVLTLYHGTTVIPNPREARILQAGDRLLCFGKLEHLRDMIPAKARRTRRPRVKKLPEPVEVVQAPVVPDVSEEE